MTTSHFLAILKKHWKTLLTTAVVGALFGLLVSVAMPVKYQANMQMLILQRYAFARDAYTASKSIEYLSNVFGEAVYSQNFIDEVLGSGYRINNTFSPNPERRKKQWKSIVKAKVSRDTGILTVAVIHRSPDQAQQITEAILSILSTKGDQYHGEGDRVKIQVLDSPSLSQYVAQPNVPANTLAAVVLALLIAFTALASGKEFEITPRTIKNLFFPPSFASGELRRAGPLDDSIEKFPEYPSEQFTPAPQYVYETIETPYVSKPQISNHKSQITNTEPGSIGFEARAIQGKSVQDIKREMHGSTGY